MAPYRRYFGRQASLEGFEIDDEILTVFERFEVVWPLDAAVAQSRGSAATAITPVDLPA
jgi:hypothetical protein